MQYFILAILMLFTAGTASAEMTNPAGSLFVDYSGRGGNNANNLVLLVVQTLLGLVGLVSIFFIVLGGFQYMNAGLSEEMAKKGKSTIQKAVVGLIIVILSYIIVVVVTNSLDKLN